MRKQLNIGIIGLGRIGKVHAKGYTHLQKNHPDLPFEPQIHSVLRTRSRADLALLAEIGNPLVTTDVQEFFAQPLDVVDICTPNFLHRVQALQAFAKGMVVYCEKPLANTLQETREMADAAVQAGVPTHTAFVFRYLPAVRQLHRAMQSQLIGKVTHFHIRYFHSNYLDPKKPMAWRLKHDLSGGGALADLGIHAIDLVQYLIGEPQWAQAQARTYVRKRVASGRLPLKNTVDVDDWGIILLGLEGDTCGYIEASRVAAGKERGFEVSIFGEKGGLFMNMLQPNHARHYDYFKDTWSDLQDAPPASEKEQHMNRIFSSDLPFGDNVHTASILDFLYGYYSGEETALNFVVAASTQQVLEASYRSAAQEGKRIVLPIK